MNAYSERDPLVQNHPPVLLFAAVSLLNNSGGIAELSRQVFRTLLDMSKKGQITLQVHVLDESGPPPDDELLCGENLRYVQWYGGRRWKFSLSLVASRSALLLVDHVGLARLPAMISSFAGRDYIALIHGVEIWNSDRNDYLQSARKARLLIANSQYTARKVEAKYSFLPEIQVCWPGKDEPVNTEKAVLNDAIGPHALLIVGRLSAEQNHKGHDHLLEAMPLIVKTIPDAQLVIAGEGDDQERLAAKVRALNLEQHVLFTGWVDEAELHGLYAQCALFVMLSVGDGFGLVFLEAMMHGAACVGLESSAAEEIIVDGETGLLVNRDDRHELGEQLSDLLKNKELRDRMGQKSFERYSRLFRGAHYSQRLQTILSSQLVQSSQESRFNQESTH